MPDSNACLLVCDDNPANRYATARTLRSEGFDVVEASTGLQAIDLIQQHHPVLVVLDVNLPDIPGFEVTSRLRADPGTASISIMHLSATYTDPQSHATGLGVGADAYLVHPFDRRVLVATVRSLLRLRAAERRLSELLEGERLARAEAERAREAAEFAERAQRSAEAQRTRLLRELEGAIRARDELLAVATHDLRSPLTALSMSLHTVLKLVAEAPQVAAVPRLQRMLEVSSEQATQLAQMLENLLDVSRINSGRLQIEREDVDLAALMREVAGRMREQFAAAGCELAVEADPSVVGRWDRIRLEQLMTNLFSNALKYGAGKPVVISARGGSEVARLVVRDRGVGIAPADLDRIFKQFERLHLKGDAKGFGLGLWIVQRIVDALGGRIHVESELGQGSIFTVDLPVREGAPAAEAERLTPA